MMVSIMKSFALGNVIIAVVLPCSTSALINNKLWGCVRDQGTEKSKTKQKKTGTEAEDSDEGRVSHSDTEMT